MIFADNELVKVQNEGELKYVFNENKYSNNGLEMYITRSMSQKSRKQANKQQVYSNLFKFRVLNKNNRNKTKATVIDFLKKFSESNKTTGYNEDIKGRVKKIMIRGKKYPSQHI